MKFRITSPEYYTEPSHSGYYDLKDRQAFYCEGEEFEDTIKTFLKNHIFRNRVIDVEADGKYLGRFRYTECLDLVKIPPVNECTKSESTDEVSRYIWQFHTKKDITPVVQKLQLFDIIHTTNDEGIHFFYYGKEVDDNAAFELRRIIAAVYYLFRNNLL